MLLCIKGEFSHFSTVNTEIWSLLCIKGAFFSFLTPLLLGKGLEWGVKPSLSFFTYSKLTWLYTTFQSHHILFLSVYIALEKFLKDFFCRVDIFPIETLPIEEYTRCSRNIEAISLSTIFIHLFCICICCETRVKCTKIRDASTLCDCSTFCIWDSESIFWFLERVHRRTELEEFSLCMSAQCAICIPESILMSWIEWKLFVDEREGVVPCILL